MVKDRLLNIEITGLRDTKGRFAKVQGELPKIRRDEMRELGRRVVSALQDEAPVRTGKLKKGIRFRTTESGSNLELRVTSEAFYTGWVIRGRGPVVAKRAMALRFEPGPPGSGFIFRKRVKASKPNPFHARAFAKLTAQGEPETTARKMARRITNAYSIA